MEVKQLLQNVFGAPATPAPAPAIPNASPMPVSMNATQGIHAQAMKQAPAPRPTKNDIFAPNILAEAQSTFSGQGHTQGGGQGGSPQNPGTSTPTKGTVGNMIPPGWSSQSGK